VVVQELIIGETSGVAFSQNPLEESRLSWRPSGALMRGLVDGTIEPDRWIVGTGHRHRGEHFEPVRRKKVASSIADPAPPGETAKGQ